MTPSFSSSLVNDVFGDPGVYVEVRWEKRAMLFDLGQNASLGPTRLLRACDIFISHTHLDHFIGFDTVLRVALGRGKTIRLFGPPGIIQNVQGKLRGYTWNLVDGYPLVLDVREFGAERVRRVLFRATDGFAPREEASVTLPTDPITGQFPCSTILCSPCEPYR
jgi:ribonuclease Z